MSNDSNQTNEFGLSEVDREHLALILKSDGAPADKIPGLLRWAEIRVGMYKTELFLSPPPPKRIRADLEEIRDALRVITWKLPILAICADHVLGPYFQFGEDDTSKKAYDQWLAETVENVQPALEKAYRDFDGSRKGRPKKIERDDFLVGVAMDYARILGRTPVPNRLQPFDKYVATVLEIIGEPLEDR